MPWLAHFWLTEGNFKSQCADTDSLLPQFSQPCGKLLSNNSNYKITLKCQHLLTRSAKLKVNANSISGNTNWSKILVFSCSRISNHSCFWVRNQFVGIQNPHILSFRFSASSSHFETSNKLVVEMVWRFFENLPFFEKPLIWKKGENIFEVIFIKYFTKYR